MLWVVEGQGEYERWVDTTDAVRDHGKRMAVLDMILSWEETGPPDKNEAPWDEEAKAQVFYVPGAGSVRVFFKTYGDDFPPSVTLLGIRS